MFLRSLRPIQEGGGGVAGKSSWKVCWSMLTLNVSGHSVFLKSKSSKQHCKSDRVWGDWCMDYSKLRF